MFARILALGSILVLASCAYAFDREQQEVTFLTPGAEDAVCYVYIEKLRYRVRPPQSLIISNARGDLTVDCLAPGGRRRKVVIESRIAPHAPLNAANGVVPGVAWDLASEALFEYPDIITVDFTSAAIVPEPPPAHNNPDIKQPEEYDLEEFLPAVPRLNSDRHSASLPVRRREPLAETGDGKTIYTDSDISEPSEKPSDKGDLLKVIKNLDMNPAAKPPVSTTTTVTTTPAPSPAAPAVTTTTTTTTVKPAAPAAPGVIGPVKPASPPAPPPQYPGQ